MQVVYVTALAPYLLLGVLLVKGLLLPGAGTGIKYYLMPNITKLAEAKVNTSIEHVSCISTNYVSTIVDT